MRDDEVYVWFRSPAGSAPGRRAVRRRVVLSATALQVHVAATDGSGDAPRVADVPGAGFVPDGLLDVVAPGTVTTLAALELELAGVWHRVEGGYVVHSLERPGHLAAVPLRWARRVWAALNGESVIPL